MKPITIKVDKNHFHIYTYNNKLSFPKNERSIKLLGVLYPIIEKNHDQLHELLPDLPLQYYHSIKLMEHIRKQIALEKDNEKLVILEEMLIHATEYYCFIQDIYRVFDIEAPTGWRFDDSV